MRNCIILGAGRSGTSMVAGALAGAGCYCGGELLGVSNSNPKGFFESREVNDINEELIARVIRNRPRYVGRYFFHSRPTYGQRWLAKVPLDVDIAPNAAIEARMAAVVRKEPYCLKDPRFAYTLPAWRPALRNVGFVCVFRDPATTIESVVKHKRESEYLADYAVDRGDIEEVWLLMYRHIVERHARQGDWLFLHYDQVLSGDGLVRLEGHLEASVDRSFPEVGLNRTRGSRAIGADTMALYRVLCDLAGFSADE